MNREKGSKKSTRSSGSGSNREEPKDPFSVDADFVKLNFQQIIENVTKKYIVWSPIESAWLRMKEESATARPVTLRKGLSSAIRSSFGGCFIRYMNKSENTTYDVTEKKMEITQFMMKLNERPAVYSRLNDYTEDIQKYLSTTVQDSYRKNGWISQNMLQGNMPTVRLCFQKITEMDSSLRGYKNVLALIMTANYIKDFAGWMLPPNLNMLELFGNLMFDIIKLMENAPSLILYLGVGRNYLSNVYNLSLLERFTYLYFLDLSENDFDNLNAVLEKLAKLSNLKCLSLDGNPCSVPVSYVHIVQRMCPQLDRLDGIMYVKDFPTDAEKDDYLGVLQIYGIRFFRVPKPPKEVSPSHIGQKVDRFYQLEFEIPLLDAALRDNEARAIRRLRTGESEQEVQNQIPKGLLTFDTSLTKSNEEDSEDVDTKKIERSYLRWLNRDREGPTTTTFMSSKVHWAKVIQFPSPAIEIPVVQEMWRQLRDTMRSTITMRLYYKEVTYKKDTKASVGPKKSSNAASRRSSRRSSRRASKRQSKAGSGRQSKAGSKRQSMKRQSKAGGGKRQSRAGGGKRASIKRKITGWGGHKSPKSTDSKKKVNIKYSKSSYKASSPKTAGSPRKSDGGNRKSRASSAGKRKSRVSSAGKRKSRVSSAGKRKSRVSSAGKRKSRVSPAGKRKSRVSSAGKRKSRASAASKRKSRGSKVASHRKSKGERRKNPHDVDAYPIPKIMTCHVGVGLKREGKEASLDKPLSRKHSQKSRKSKTSRKSRLSRKSKSSRKSRTGRKSKTGGQRKSVKRASKTGQK